MFRLKRPSADFHQHEIIHTHTHTHTHTSVIAELSFMHPNTCTSTAHAKVPTARVCVCVCVCVCVHVCSKMSEYRHCHRLWRHPRARDAEQVVCSGEDKHTRARALTHLPRWDTRPRIHPSSQYTDPSPLLQPPWERSEPHTDPRRSRCNGPVLREY